MIIYVKGNLLASKAEALVNTVNTVGVMGKGIALMFKEKFPQNMRKYKTACNAGLVKVGEMFITEQIGQPKWIINFPTKKHWRNPSKIEWIEEGLKDLHRVIVENSIKSIAIPPLGAGNGGLNWEVVKKNIEIELGNINDVEIYIYQPTKEYMNVTKKYNDKLTPARALISEVIRRYWILGIDCSILEVQKLAWFLESSFEVLGLKSPLKCSFKPHYYGPYADNLRHLLNNLDGKFLLCDKRINDAKPLDIIWFNNKYSDEINTYLSSEEMQPYLEVLEFTSKTIEGFESPYGMELLSTVDWILKEDKVEPTVDALIDSLKQWKDAKTAERKIRLFPKDAIAVALERLIGIRGGSLNVI